jgi:hypothetical protein
MPFRGRSFAQVALACLTLAAAGCIQQPMKLSKDDSPVVLARQDVTAQNPATAGTYRVRTLV